MNNLSPSIQEVSESRRCAVHIGFNTADIVYLICDHLTLGEAAVLAFVSSSLMDILRGKLAKLNVDGNLEHSQYAMQRLRFFDYKMPGKYWCMPCDQYHPWDKTFGGSLRSILHYGMEKHPDPARDIRVHSSATIAAPNIQLLKRAQYYGRPEYGIGTWYGPHYRYLGDVFCGESLRECCHYVNGSWSGRGLIWCINSKLDIAVRSLEGSAISAKDQCVEVLAQLICMCEEEPRHELAHHYHPDFRRELPKARVLQFLASFLCNCHPQY